MKLRWSSIVLLSCLLPAVALAQEPEPEPEAGDAVEMAEEEPVPLFDDSGDPTGADENPNAPSTSFTADDEPDADAKPKVVRTGYPTELIHRPLTLPRGMAELSLDLPVRLDPFRANMVVRGSYGINDKVEIGLSYGLGALHEDGFEAGKAVALDLSYQLTSWIAPQISLPFYVDPFAMGVTLGAPFRFTLFDKIALAGGADLLRLKISRFAPVIDDAVRNEASVIADEFNTRVSCCELNLIGQFIYQLDTQAAFDLRFGIVKDLDTVAGQPDDTGVLLDVGYLYAISNKLDVGARLGFERLDDPGDSLLAQLFGAIRI